MNVARADKNTASWAITPKTIRINQTQLKSMHTRLALRVVSIVVVGVLILSMSAQKSSAAGTNVYIHSDGSIDPSNAPISTADRITYMLTDDTFCWLVIERDGIVFDGAGHRIFGGGAGRGITLSSRVNVTVSNVKIEAFYDGVWISGSSQINLSGNDIDANNDDGINVRDSSNFTNIAGNNITNNVYYGIMLHETANNTVTGNNITGNTQYGIYFYVSSEANTIVSNMFDENKAAVSFWESSGNVLFHNNFMSNTRQVYDASWDYPLTPSTNSWDNNYPSGGNYWSNYSAVDTKSGSGQNISGSDGIGDVPQTLYGNNQDRYPLITTYTIPELSSVLLASLLTIMTSLVAVAFRRKTRKANG